MEGFCNEEIIYEDLEKEFSRMDIIYKGWRLPIHSVKQGNKPIPLQDSEGPPYHVDLFEPYVKYTYFSVCQVLGMDALEYMSIVPMIITADI